MSETVAADVILKPRLGPYPSARRQRVTIGSTQPVYFDVVDALTGALVPGATGVSALYWAPPTIGTDAPGQPLDVFEATAGTLRVIVPTDIPGAWRVWLRIEGPSVETAEIVFDVPDDGGVPTTIPLEDWRSMQAAAAAAGASAGRAEGASAGAAGGASAGSVAGAAAAAPYADLAQQRAAQASASAGVATTAAQTATDRASAATTSATAADQRATAAEAARASAEAAVQAGAEAVDNAALPVATYAGIAAAVPTPTSGQRVQVYADPAEPAINNPDGSNRNGIYAWDGTEWAYFGPSVRTLDTRLRGQEEVVTSGYQRLDGGSDAMAFAAPDAAGMLRQMGYVDQSGALHWASILATLFTGDRVEVGTSGLQGYDTLEPGEIFVTDAGGRLVSSYPKDVASGYDTLEPGGVQVLDGEGRIVGVVPSLSVEQDVATTKSEVTTARGTTTSLSGRLAIVTDAAGHPLSPSWGLFLLRQTRMKIRRILYGAATEQLNVSLIGDSTTYLPNITTPLTLGLRSALGNAGGGYVNTLEVVSGTPFAAAGEITTIGKAPADAWTRVASASEMPDMGYQSSSTVGAKLTVNSQSSAAPINGCRMLYLPVSGASARYRWNGGAWTTVDLGVGTGPSGVDLAGVPTTAAWTLEVEVVAGECRIGGWYLSNSTRPGVRVNKLGQNGSTAGIWAARDQARQIQGWQLLGHQDLYILALSTNDQINHTPASTAASILTLRNRARLAHPACDVLVVQPPENQNNRTTLMRDITAAVRAMCVANRIAFLDQQYAFGDTVAEYAVGSAHDWQTDLTHPNSDYGGPASAEAILRSILYSI